MGCSSSNESQKEPTFIPAKEPQLTDFKDFEEYGSKINI